MRFPNKTDEEIYGFIRMSTKIGNGPEMFSKLVERTEKNKEDADSWFYRALAAWELMNETLDSEWEAYRYYAELLAGCEHAVSLNHNHWPALYLRSLVALLTRGKDKDIDEMVSHLLPVDYTPEKAEKDRIKMIEIQQDQEPQPFFLIPYAAQALANVNEHKMEEAVAWIRRGLTETLCGPISYLYFILQIPVYFLYKKLTAYDPEIAEVLGQRYVAMFQNKESQS